MKPHELKAARGARSPKRRVGRGNGSGRGTTAGRGTKGTRARGTVRAFFEGGQMPLVRRVPKLKGFRSPNRREFAAVNVGDLEALGLAEITPEDMRNAGLVHKRHDLIKLLGEGDVGAPLTVRVHAASASARSKIEAAGGAVEVVEQQERKAGS